MNVAIITEGFEGTGYGHLTRCLSLWQAFEERGVSPIFITNCDENGKRFLENIKIKQFDWLNNKGRLFKEIKNFDIAIIDSYLAPIDLYEQLTKTVHKIVFIDDYIRLNYPTGTIINGSIGAENLNYNKRISSKYLLGIDYMPLRKEFWDIQMPIQKKDRIEDVLITFGGQDIRNLTLPVLEMLNRNLPKLNYHVVLGISNFSESKNNYENNVKFYNSLDGNSMLNLMLTCDMAVTAAGQTTYELARVGLTTVAVGIADNQKYNIKGWLEKGFITREIWFDEKDFYDNLLSNINECLSYGKTRQSFLDGSGSRNIFNELVS